jgi:hypothetical protein
LRIAGVESAVVVVVAVQMLVGHPVAYPSHAVFVHGAGITIFARSVVLDVDRHAFIGFGSRGLASTNLAGSFLASAIGRLSRLTDSRQATVVRSAGI